MRISRSILKAWPAALSAVLYSLAFSPFNLGLLVFVALVPWFLSLKKSTPWGAFRSGLTFGALFWTYQMFWLMPFVGRWVHSYLLGSVPWLLCPPVGMWYFGFLGWLVQRCYASRRLWMIPLLWAGVEVIRAYFPMLAFPWGLLAAPLWFLPPIIQGASMGQIFLVSSWVALINVIAAVLLGDKSEVTPSSKRQVLQMTIVAVAFLFLSLGRYQQATPGEMRKITIGQTGVDLAFGDKRTEFSQLRAACQTQFKRAVEFGADLLILPEGLARGGDELPPNTPFGMTPPLPVLFGGQRGTGPTYQTAYSYDGEWQYEDKTRLVVFGEYVPYREHLPFLKAFDLPGGDLQPGNEIKVLKIGQLKVAPVVCFEELFPNIPNLQAQMGAQMLAVISVDDWFVGTPAPEQLASSCVWRAVENGLPMFRSASTGSSYACDARGNVLARAPLGGLQTLNIETRIPNESDAFPYRWVYPLLGLASVAWIVLEAVARRIYSRKKSK